MLSMPDKYKVAFFQTSMKNKYISGEQTKKNA